MRRKTSFIALLLCVCFLLATSAFAALHIDSHTHYADSHAHHACTEEHCEVCLQIAHFQHTLKQFCMPLLAMAFCIAALAAIVVSMVSSDTGFANGLVSRKVQLNT